LEKDRGKIGAMPVAEGRWGGETDRDHGPKGFCGDHTMSLGGKQHNCVRGRTKGFSEGVVPPQVRGGTAGPRIFRREGVLKGDKEEGGASYFIAWGADTGR